MKSIGAKQGINMFLERDEHATRGREAPQPRKKTEILPTEQSMLLQTEQKYTASKYTGNLKNFCCSICAHQFYPPREFFDYEATMDAQDSFLETMEKGNALTDTQQSEGMGCCVACRKDMYGGVADSEWEKNQALGHNDGKAGKKQSEAAQKAGGPINRMSTHMSDMSPRNPENMRDYKGGKHGGPIDPSTGSNSALATRTPSTAGT
ncbi:hypothetical protein OAV88_03655 [bacterium]|jgi:hypothetical protein|nr:hypothetical protein [bacterium]